MSRQAMQVYFDKDIVEFYKEYARVRGKSFAAAVREVLEKHKNKVQKNKITLGQEHKSLLKTIKEIEKRFTKSKYYHPELTDDELLYGK